MSASVGFATDASRNIPRTVAGNAPPKRRTAHEAWSPLVIASLWWGLIAYACVRALLSGG